MPSKNGKSRRRKIAKSRRQFSKASVARNPFANHRDVKMCYASNITLTSTLGTPGGALFRANNIYDPDYSNLGTNHSPFGFTELTGIYNWYNVYACKIELEAISTAPCVFTCRPQGTATTPANLELDEERGNSVHCLINANGSPKKCSMFRYTSDILGMPKNGRFTEVDYKGTSSGTSPTLKTYWALCCQHPDRASTVSAYINVKLTYYVRWTDRKLLSQS